jgi:hypothetical protein
LSAVLWFPLLRAERDLVLQMEGLERLIGGKVILRDDLFRLREAPLLGGLAARAGGAEVMVGALRVTFWGALAMGFTAGVGIAVWKSFLKEFVSVCITGEAWTLRRTDQVTPCQV